MTSRDRVLAALAHQATDRVPRLLYEEVVGYTPPIERLLRAHCAPQSPLEYFAMDLTRVTWNPTLLPRERFAPWLGAEADAALSRDEVDEWGAWRRKGGIHDFVHFEPTLGGIRESRELEDYPWPDLDQAYRWEGVRARVEALQAQGLAVVGYAGSVFERSWYLRGMENLMMDMVTAPGLAHGFFERTAALQRKAAAAFARAGADIVITGDDVGGQKGLLMSLGMWRQFLKPRLAATVRAVKEARPETFFFYHSDGNIEALIPDLIEIGVDILNPVQPECMDPAAIKRRFGGALSFWGTVSVQRTMPSGTPDEVRAEVRARVRDVGRGGGLILAPAHVLGPETPWENIVAFFDAADSAPVR
ncbi:MAG TPA: uroporphyrinogen decarboxylase family protein [Verrucomicrobiota bacterium]|nr:uroporphyrinogen decarboxylase family protein [Verrucomicrobiota bacterium]HNU49804.1 uroporphyrinogen decarboxylase family protein [Verrucomicrobiota bacterium]